MRVCHGMRIYFFVLKCTQHSFCGQFPVFFFFFFLNLFGGPHRTYVLWQGDHFSTTITKALLFIREISPPELNLTSLVLPFNHLINPLEISFGESEVHGNNNTSFLNSLIKLCEISRWKIVCNADSTLQSSTFMDPITFLSVVKATVDILNGSVA